MDYCIIKSHYLQHVDVCNRGDVVEIETWCQREGRIGIKRDCSEVLGRATRCITTLFLSFLCLINCIHIMIHEVLDEDVGSQMLLKQEILVFLSTRSLMLH